MVEVEVVEMVEGEVEEEVLEEAVGVAVVEEGVLPHGEELPNSSELSSQLHSSLLSQSLSHTHLEVTHLFC